MRFLYGILLVLLSSLAISEELTSKQQTIELSDKFISFIEKGEFEKALAVVSPYWPIPKHEIESMAYQISSQMPNIVKRYGNPISVSHVKNMVINDSFYKRIYLQKLTNHALVWYVTFYKPNDKWVVSHVKFDDKIDSLYRCEKT